MRRRHSGQIAGMETIARRKLDKEWHRRSDEMRAAWATGATAVDICFHDPAAAIDEVAVETRAVRFVFPDNTEAPERGAVSFATARDVGAGHDLFATVEVGLLVAQIDHYTRAAGVTIGHVRGDKIADGAASIERQRHEADGEKSETVH